MNIYKNLPLYYVSLDGAKGMEAIALVEYPAMEVDFLTFKADKRPICFASDEERHIITGVAIIANKPIYRRKENDEYYIVFTKDVIEQLVLKYAKENRFNEVKLHHDDEQYQDGIYMIESYFVDHKRGLVPSGLGDIEDGSWVVSFKVENEGLWRKIKESGELNGFSIEGYIGLKEGTEEDWLDQFLDKKKRADFAKPVTTDDIKKAMGRRVLIDGVEAQVYAIGKDGRYNNIIYQDADGNWIKKDIVKIKSFKPLTSPITDWNFEDPVYRALMDDENNIIRETEVAREDTLEEAVKGNFTCIITYNDDSDSPATGSRQCWVSSMGYTIAGNACIRIYELHGASKTGVQENDGWRFLLIRRITSFRILRYTEPFTTPPSPLYNGEASAGSGINGSMDSVKIISNLL